MTTFQNKTVQKFISCLLLLAILSPAAFLGFAMPKKAEAVVPVTDIPSLMIAIKDIILTILKAFLRVVATKLLDKITQSTINWVNTGFKGAPLFVQNPGSFFMDVVHTELAGFIDEVAYDTTRFPFGQDYAVGVINKAVGTFASNSEYTLSKLYANDPTEYARQQNDFAAGGWNGLLMNTQLMQNNFIGYGLIADNEVNQRLTGTYSAPQQIKDKLAQGTGFLSQVTCKSNPKWDPAKLAQSPAPTDPAYAAYQFTYGCPEGPSTVTPGRAAADSIMTALGSKQRQGELSAQAGNALAAIFDAVINKVLDAGLSAAGNLVAGSGNPPTADPLKVKLQDFNQFGDKGGSEKGGYIGSPPNSTAPHVSVTVNIINDNGGQTYDPGILQAYLDDSAIKTNTPINASVGAHKITLQDLAGYYKIITGDCDKEGNVVLVSSQDTTCDFTLDDIPTGDDHDDGNMVVQVNVINDNDGQYLTPPPNGNNLTLLVNNAPRLSGVVYEYIAGWANVTVTLPDKGYTLTWVSGCNAQGAINIHHICEDHPSPFGGYTTCDRSVDVCNVTLNDIPGWHLKREKVDIVVKNNAAVPGTLTANQLQALVDDNTQTTVPPIQAILSGPLTNTYTTDIPPKLTGSTTTGIPNIYSAGDSQTAPEHAVTVTTVAGVDPAILANYSISYSGNCSGDGTFTLVHTNGAKDANGIETDVSTCTVTFDDND